MTNGIMEWAELSDVITENNNKDSCNAGTARSNSTLITNAYEGIPETLTLNLICWISLLLLFSILRRSAWNYGRLALVHRNRWTQMFYSGAEAEDRVQAQARAREDADAPQDSRYCGWIPAVLSLRVEQVSAKCGPDAGHYLSFQYHLILLTCFVTAISVCVILPINFHGELEGDRKTFGHTTISNLEPKSSWLWVHAILGFLYLPVSILLMRRSSASEPLPDYATRTLIISNIPKRDRDVSVLKNNLKSLFPQVGILDVQLAHDTRDLMEVDEKRELASQAKSFCEIYRRRTGKNVEVRVSLCGEKVDGIQYYTAEEEKLTGETERMKAAALNSPLGVAFVTLSSCEEIKYVLARFRSAPHRGWLVNRAPAPTDIYWQNLNVEPSVWYLKAFCINFFLFLVLFFLTTPAIIVNMIDTLYMSPDNLIKISPLISEFLPTLLLCSMAALLPVIVSYSDQWLSHWTRSGQTYSIMMKTFIFLLAMTLILPSLGLTSAQAFFEWTLQEGNSTYRWECVFLPDKGAFFVNYVITSALIGTALELIRFPELFMYVCYLLGSKSKAEKGSVQKAILLEFPFGVHYAWTLVVFTITTVYSIPCPLIAPFGLLYLMLKHFGDKHNLYFAYGFSDMSGIDGGKIHATAVRLVRISVLLLQISMAGLAGIRGGMDARTVVLILFTLISFGLFVMLSPFPSCKPQSLSQESPPPVHSKYIAPVLLKNIQRHSDLTPVFDYGSSDTISTQEIQPPIVNI